MKRKKTPGMGSRRCRRASMLLSGGARRDIRNTDIGGHHRLKVLYPKNRVCQHRKTRKGENEHETTMCSPGDRPFDCRDRDRGDGHHDPQNGRNRQFHYRSGVSLRCVQLPSLADRQNMEKPSLGWLFHVLVDYGREFPDTRFFRAPR